MKAIVITQDSASRINPINGEVIEAFRPSVVTVTEFVTNLVMKRLLKPVGGPLSDKATDAEFLKFYTAADKNTDLSVSSFMSKFYVEEELVVPTGFEEAVRNREVALRDEEDARATAQALADEEARLQAEKTTQETAAKEAGELAAKQTAAHAAAAKKPGAQ